MASPGFEVGQEALLQVLVKMLLSQARFRRALPAIFDSNACTILTSLVLAYLGTGPVKGFAKPGPIEIED